MNQSHYFLTSVDLKKKKASYFIQKMSLFKNRELQFGAIKLWQTICKSREQRRESCFMEERNCEGLFWRVLDGDSFSLAECHSFSLTELLLGKEKFFPSPAGICKVRFLLFGSQRWGLRALPSGLSNTICNEDSFIFIHLKGKQPYHWWISKSCAIETIKKFKLKYWYLGLFKKTCQFGYNVCHWIVYWSPLLKMPKFQTNTISIHNLES